MDDPHPSQQGQRRAQFRSAWTQGIVITVVGGVLASLVWYYMQGWLQGQGGGQTPPASTPPAASPRQSAPETSSSR